MSFEEEFDKIIQQKTSEADFPFDEANWEKARQMLDKDRKVVGMGLSGKLYIAAVLLLSFSIGGYFLYTQLNTTSETRALSQNNANAVSAQSESINANNNVKVSTANTISEQKTIPRVTETGTLKSDDVKQSTVASDKNTASRTQYVNTETPSSDTQKAEAKSPTSPMLANAVKTKNRNSSHVNKKAAATTNGTDKTTDASEPGNAESETAIAASKAGVTDNKTATNPSDPYTQTNSFKSEKTDKHNETAYDQSNDLLYESLVLNIPSRQQVSDPEINLPALNPLNYFDDDYYAPEKIRKHYLSVEAGGNYMFGWDAKNGRDGQGLNWFGGINYGMYVSKKVELSAGLQFYNVGNIKQPFFNYAITEFGFSSITTQTKITTNSIYYASLPLKFAYALNPQSQIGIGCNIGLLVSSRNTVDTYAFSSEKTISRNSVKTNGYYEGMNTTNILLSAFYKTKLANRLYINGEVTYAPINIYKYAKTEQNTANNLGLRITLQYTLFEK